MTKISEAAKVDEHPNAEDYRNRAERAAQALAEMVGDDGLSPDDIAVCDRLENYTGYAGQLADIVQLTTRVRALSEQLATERANADRLAEALGALAFLTAEVLPQPQKEIAAILAAHNLLRIDG